jgi:hypothetical protein
MSRLSPGVEVTHRFASIDCARRTARFLLPATAKKSGVEYYRVGCIQSVGFLMKKVTHSRASTARRCGSAVWAAAFLFFLLYSAPHQVHHVFEQLPQAHHHDADHEHSTPDRHDHSSSGSNCVFQISASRCHLAVAQHVAPTLLAIVIGVLPDFHSSDDATNLVAAFHIRAPPLA